MTPSPATVNLLQDGYDLAIGCWRMAGPSQRG